MPHRDPEKRREKDRRYGRSEAGKEKNRAWMTANPEKTRASRMLHYHGLRPENWATLYDAQQGLCYLCGKELAGKIVIDHDHDCCPRNTSCRACRRGLVHSECNVAIGMAGDDPATLRRMADALEAAQRAYQARKAEGGGNEQLALIG